MDEQQMDKMLEEELAEELSRDNSESSEEGSESEESNALNDVLDIVESVITSIFVVLLIFTFICRPVTVEGGSMNPTLENGDKLLMGTFMCTPEQGDIVIVDNKNGYVFKDSSQKKLTKSIGIIPNEGETSKKIIKRVIATGGQVVDFDEEKGDVYVDGKLVEEDYVLMNIDSETEQKYKPSISSSGAFTYPVTVPEGYVFVLGDNRNNSTDSRSTAVGFVKEEDIIGEAFFRFYPFNLDKLDIF